MGQKKYILTISILASNRKDTLPKTLASIKPLLDAVPSELIIVDTGCDEELLEHIRTYTDKIIKFEWCKDFSKARNTGLFKAQGDWFMFIDDDEWFEDISEIIDFFKGDEKDKYGFAKYIVRNYSNWEGTKYTDGVVGRIFKIFPETKFVDAVHEKPINIAGPTKNFMAYAHHYGYVYKSEEEEKAHLERNISLLKNQIESDPTKPRHYAHLAQEYCSSKEHEKVLETTQLGIERAVLDSNENKRDVSSLYAIYVWALINLQRHDEAYTKAVEYGCKEYCNDLAKCMLAEFKALAKYVLGEYDEAIACAEEYFGYIKKFELDMEARYAQSAIMIMNADSEENIVRVAAVAFGAASSLCCEEKIEEYVKYLDFTKHIPMPRVDVLVKGFVDVMVKTSRIVWCANIADELLKNDQFGGGILCQIMELGEKDMQGFYKVADVMSLTKSRNGYVQYLRIVSARRDMYADRLNDLYRKAINSISDLINIDRMFFTIAADRNIDISSMMDDTPIDRWANSVDSWMVNVKIAKLIEKKMDLDNALRADGIHMIYFNAAMSEALLLRKRLDNATKEGIEQEFLNFIEESMRYYKIIFRPEIFSTYPTVLPNRCQVALLLKAWCDKSMTDWQEVKRKVLKLMPRLKNVLDKYEEIA